MFGQRRDVKYQQLGGVAALPRIRLRAVGGRLGRLVCGGVDKLGQGRGAYKQAVGSGIHRQVHFCVL